MSKTYKFSNAELVVILKEVLAAMEVKEVNRFRIRAYQNVITELQESTLSAYDLWENGRISEIPGVGGTLTQHFDELFTTGKVDDFDDIKKDLPQGMFSLIGIRGIGAKKAFKLANAFDLNDRETAVAELKKAAEAEKIRELDGFGAKSESEILNAITEMKMHKTEKQRMLYVFAREVADRVIDYINEDENVVEAEALGSLRRKESTVGDLDVAVATNDPEATVEHFKKFNEIEDLLGSGEKGARAVLKNDVQVDMRVTSPDAYGAMVQYFTGSRAHNINLRKYALEKNLSLNEHGIKKGKELVKIDTDENFYKYIDLQYIPPELRQGKNEIDLAIKKKLPKLVELSDLKGDIHTHTDFSDGHNTLEEMAEKAISLGYEYLGISDHAPSVTNRGQEEVLNIISNQHKAIEQYNETNTGLTLLLGYEVNILVSAELAMPDEVLSELDYVVASIHAGFNQDREQVTKRMISAIENPYVKVIGHPSGRLINKREGCDIDWLKVFDAAAANNTILEINSQPDRLDLADQLVHEAINKGVKIIISSDAHHTDHMDYMKYGIHVAQRGWCTSENIVNTLPKKEFLRLLTKNK